MVVDLGQNPGPVLLHCVPLLPLGCFQLLQERPCEGEATQQEPHPCPKEDTRTTRLFKELLSRSRQQHLPPRRAPDPTSPTGRNRTRSAERRQGQRTQPLKPILLLLSPCHSPCTPCREGGGEGYTCSAWPSGTPR